VVKEVIRQIMSGEVTDHLSTAQPRLGIVGGNVTLEMAEEYGIAAEGAYVSSVADGEAAYLAGILPEDIITAINGISIADFEALRAVILQHRPGDAITLTVLRNGSEVLTLQAVLGAGF
jgi:S1-C subfamily serine protease